MSALKELASYLGAGESIPLPWAVQHHSSFEREWAQSENPELMLEIAAYVVPVRDLVFVAADVADTVLGHIGGRRGAPMDPLEAEVDVQDHRYAISLAKRLANGERVKKGEVDFAKDAVYGKDSTAHAAIKLAMIGTAGSYDKELTASYARDVVIGAINAAGMAAYNAVDESWEPYVQESLSRRHIAQTAAHKTASDAARAEIVEIVRSGLRGKITIGKIVAAAKEARR